MPLPNTFASLTQPQMIQLDQNFAAIGALTAIPCTVSGTNSLTFAPSANTPTVSAYTNYQPFSGISPSANTGGVTINVGSLGVRNVYKDTPGGPVALTGGEIGIGTLIYAVYDFALNAGAGGFHLVGGRPVPAAQFAASSAITSSVGVTLSAAQLTGNGTGQGVILRQGSPSGGFSDQTPTATLIVGALPGAIVSTLFRCRVVNTSGQTETLTAGTSVSLFGTTTTSTGATHDLLGVVAAVGGSPSVSIYG